MTPRQEGTERSGPSMVLEGVTSLAVHAAVAVVIAVVALVVLRWTGVILDPAPVLVLALGLAGVRWLSRRRVETAPALQAPSPEHADRLVRPDAYDLRVRRLEDMVHGAHPSRMYTATRLAHTLLEIAEAAPPEARARLSPPLQDLLRRAREGSTVPGLDRRTLHRYLRELDALDPGIPTGEEAAP